MGPGTQEVRSHVRCTRGQSDIDGVLMTAFIGRGLTGRPLSLSHSPWAKGCASTVGGFTAILFFHKFCAVLLTADFLIHLGDIVYRGVVKREKGVFWGPNSLVPRGKDFVDLYEHVRWFLWLGPPPKFDPFSYWGKINYWAVFWGKAIIGISGSVIGFWVVCRRFTPGNWL